MKIEKKKRGRPPKKGAKDPWYLARALKILCAYDKARTDGAKHESAIREAAAFVKQFDPEMPASETEVKRILAELRPSRSRVAFKSNCEIVEGEEAARIRSHVAGMRAFDGSEIPSKAPDKDPTRPLKKFSIFFGKRQNYPRTNRKTAKELLPLVIL